MPSSRKRNKGKVRKAKKAENERAELRSIWVGWAHGKEYEICLINLTNYVLW